MQSASRVKHLEHSPSSTTLKIRILQKMYSITLNFMIKIPAASFIMIAFLVTVGCTLPPLSITGSESKKAPTNANQRFQVLDAEDLMTSRELMGLLIAFSETYMEQIMEVADRVISNPKTSPQERAMFLSMKTYYLTAAISNATHLNPEAGLLDMATMVTLQRMVWEKIAASGNGSAEDAKSMLQRLKGLETAIWTLVKRVLRPEQEKDLRQLIIQWKRDHPDTKYVAFVRFQDFAQSRMKDNLDEVIVRGGLLAPLDDVSREVHEARMLAERSIFWLKRMPMLLQLHGSLMGYEALALPETGRLMDSMEEIVLSADLVAQTIHELPATARNVRKEALEDLEAKLVIQQKNFFDNLQLVLNSQRAALFESLEASTEELGHISSDASVAARELRLIFDALERILKSQTPRKPGEPSEIEKISTTVALLKESVVELNTLSANLESIFSKIKDIEDSEAIRGIDSLLIQHERRIAVYGGILLLIAFVLCLVLIKVARYRKV
jgi:hypothetical protein